MSHFLHTVMCIFVRCNPRSLQVVFLHQLGKVLASQARSNADDVMDATHSLQITTRS